MRAAACAASSLADNWNPPSRAVRTRRIEGRGWWWRKGVVVGVRAIGTTDRSTVVLVPVVVVGSDCRVEQAIIGAAAPGSRSSPQSSTWRLAGAAGLRGVWQAGPRYEIRVPRA